MLSKSFGQFLSQLVERVEQGSCNAGDQELLGVLLGRDFPVLNSLYATLRDCRQHCSVVAKLSNENLWKVVCPDGGELSIRYAENSHPVCEQKSDTSWVPILLWENLEASGCFGRSFEFDLNWKVESQPQQRMAAEKKRKPGAVDFICSGTFADLGFVSMGEESDTRVVTISFFPKMSLPDDCQVQLQFLNEVGEAAAVSDVQDFASLPKHSFKHYSDLPTPEHAEVARFLQPEVSDLYFREGEFIVPREARALQKARLVVASDPTNLISEGSAFQPIRFDNDVDGVWSAQRSFRGFDIIKEREKKQVPSQGLLLTIGQRWQAQENFLTNSKLQAYCEARPSVKEYLTEKVEGWGETGLFASPHSNDKNAATSYTIAASRNVKADRRRKQERAGEIQIDDVIKTIATPVLHPTEPWKRKVDRVLKAMGFDSHQSCDQQLDWLSEFIPHISSRPYISELFMYRATGLTYSEIRHLLTERGYSVKEGTLAADVSRARTKLDVLLSRLPEDAD